MKKHFSKEEVFDLTEEEGSVKLSSQPSKHGMVLQTWIVPFEGNYWKFTFKSSEEEGWQLDGGVNAVQVKPQEKIVSTIEWVEVKE